MIEIYLKNTVFHESPCLSRRVYGGNLVLSKDIININVLKKKSERSRKIQRCGVLKNPIFDLKIQFFLYSRGSFLNILDQNLVSQKDIIICNVLSRKPERSRKTRRWQTVRNKFSKLVSDIASGLRVLEHDVTRL